MIDDEEFTISPAMALLESKGAEVDFQDSLTKGLNLLEKGGDKGTFDLVVIDLRFTNGIPGILRKYLDQPDEDRAFQRYGTALGEWLKEHRPGLPFIYYTVLPDRTGDSEITVDKLKDEPRVLLDRVQERLQVR
ncbi:MAG: hypothetical protein LGR52_00450 [Candidatus Thiosymbion ectosymbiont of Robbea hypermnestra]|nr:hypothetical protein [Candidatus Thiosymbion ectosymbiont of Robbea hypermnestra]